MKTTSKTESNKMRKNRSKHTCASCGGPKPSHVNWDEVGERDLNRMATHEAGHFVVGEHLGVFPMACIKDTGCRCLDNKAFMGRTFYEPGDGMSAYQQSVLGWSGLLAERIRDCTSLDDFIWEASLLSQEWDLTEDMSLTDLKLIESHHQTWRTCKNSAEILWKKREMLFATIAELKRTFVIRSPEADEITRLLHEANWQEWRIAE